MVEFLSCNKSTTPSLAEYVWVYLNFKNSDSRGDRPMLRNLPKSVHLLYFLVTKYLDIKNDHKLRTGEFIKNIFFTRLTDRDLILSSIGMIPRAANNLESWEYLLRPRKYLPTVPWCDSSLLYIALFKNQTISSPKVKIGRHMLYHKLNFRSTGRPGYGIQTIFRLKYDLRYFKILLSTWLMHFLSLDKIMPKISILSTLSIGTWPSAHFGSLFNIVCTYDIHLVFLIPNLKLEVFE